MVSASRGVEIETSSKVESRSRNVFFMILLPYLGGLPLTRFSKTRMLLQAGERAVIDRVSDACQTQKGCGAFSSIILCLLCFSWPNFIAVAKTTLDQSAGEFSG